MAYANGTRVRVKIPGHCTFGAVVETVGRLKKPSAVPDRYYLKTGASKWTPKHTWASHNTTAPCQDETILVRIEVEGKKAPLYRVMPDMLELAEAIRKLGVELP